MANQASVRRARQRCSSLYKINKTKRMKEVHSLSLAQTLTLPAALRPNHLVTNNFRRLCTQFCPMCTTQNSHMCRIRFSLREISWIACMCRITLHMQPIRKHDLAPCTYSSNYCSSVPGPLSAFCHKVGENLVTFWKSRRSPFPGFFLEM